VDNPQPSSILDPDFPVRNLVGALDALLVRLPQSLEEASERKRSILLACAGLNEKGLEAESLIRYSMSGHISVSLIAAILIDTIVDGGDTPIIDAVRWREALQIPLKFGTPLEQNDDGTVPHEASQEFFKEFHRIRPILRRWVENASFANVLDLAPPTQDELAAFGLEADPDTDVVDGYIWILQRSTQPDDPQHWSNASLFAEFRWLEGQGSPPFADSALSERGPIPSALHYEIAKRAANPPEGDPDEFDPLLWQIQDQAQTLLRRGQYAEASALFEFYYRLHPESKQALNNLAFCKLPIDPSSSLHHLKRAEKAGFTPLVINIYNQCCCLMMLSREGEALDRAEHYWQRERDGEKAAGYLWRQSNNGPLEFYSEPDALLAIAKLAKGLAQELGLTGRVEKWNERIEEIISAWSTGASGTPLPDAGTRA
jgi:hypothetical protein